MSFSRQPPAAPTKRRSFPRPWLGALVLVCGILASYQPVLEAGFIWDDESNVTANATLRDLDGLLRIWSDRTANQQYYPLTHTSFWVEHQLWGLRPLGYHLVNLALHAASALLLWCLLVRLGIPGAWLAAAIFAVHPVQVESVAWVSERKNTLSAVFFLAAAYAGIRFQESGDGWEGPGATLAPAPRRRGWYALCAALFLCAVLAKSATCLLPVVLALLLWWKTGRVTARSLSPLLPLALLGVAAGLNTAWLEQHHVGAAGSVFSHSVAEKALIAGRASWFYLGKLLLPTGICFIYPQWRIEAADVVAYLYPAATLATLGTLWGMRDKTGRGPLAAALYFGVMLFPALGFFKVYFMRYSYVQDHFQYLACIGPLTLFGAGVARANTLVARRFLPQRREGGWRAAGPALAAAAALVILLPLGMLARDRTRVYRDSEMLWRDTLATNPAAWMAHNNLGVILLGRGRTAEAASHFRASLQVRPDLAESWVNLGDALMAGNETPRALEQYRKAMELAPGLPMAHVGLGAALEREGRQREAEEQFAEALRLDPASADAGRHLARLRLRAGEAGRAALLLERLLQRDPSQAGTHTLYGEVLATRGQFRDAERHYREAIRLSPDDAEAHLGLGALLAAQGDLAAAAASLFRAAGLKPSLAEAHYDLGKVLDLQDRPAEAMQHYRRAIDANPAFAEAHNNLGVDLLLLRQPVAGTAHLREALRLRPDYEEARVNLERADARR